MEKAKRNRKLMGEIRKKPKYSALISRI